MPTRQNVEDIVKIVKALSKAEKAKLLKETQAALSRKRRSRTPDRILNVKTLVALLPESLEAIRTLLKSRKGREAFEVHFTLFCFLDDAQSFSAEINKSIYSAVTDYVACARTNTAHAAWMAGDLLGDHWSGNQVMGDLIDLATSAHYVAGREAALYGIEKRFGDVGMAERSEVLRRLELISKSDRSQKVRSYSSLVIRYVEKKT